MSECGQDRRATARCRLAQGEAGRVEAWDLKDRGIAGLGSRKRT